MPKIVITDVLYTNSDETFYVLDRPHDNAAKYCAETLDKTFENLKADGWNRCGKVNKSDGSLADMCSDGKINYIAVWEE